METFDFIEDAFFRSSLNSDYQEMRSSLESKCWKGALVLSGSIVEAMLVDYLHTTPNPSRPAKPDPLSMTLDVAVQTCLREKVISERLANLCTVVRSYRNLIHPGKMVRQSESAPDEDAARVAASLVSMIAREVGAARTSKHGYSAEQVVSKLIKDDNALSIFKHLIAATDERAKRDLLLDVIPREHRSAYSEELPWVIDRLERAFVQTFRAASKATRDAVASDFVSKLKTAEESYVTWYRRAFLFNGYVEHLAPADHDFLVDYLFGLTNPRDPDSLSAFNDIGGALRVSDVSRFTKIFSIGASLEKQWDKYLGRYQSLAFTVSDEFFRAAQEKFAEMAEHGPMERRSLFAQLVNEVDNEIPF